MHCVVKLSSNTGRCVHSFQIQVEKYAKYSTLPGKRPDCMCVSFFQSIYSVIGLAMSWNHTLHSKYCIRSYHLRQHHYWKGRREVNIGDCYMEVKMNTKYNDTTIGDKRQTRNREFGDMMEIGHVVTLRGDCYMEVKINTNYNDTGTTTIGDKRQKRNREFGDVMEIGHVVNHIVITRSPISLYLSWPHNFFSANVTVSGRFHLITS